MLPVETPFKVYTGLDGKPLDGGYVYFGTAGQNPITNPITVYWDAAGTQPAAQPLRTQNGYVMRAGTPANVFVSGAYSELVLDKKQRQVFYSQTSADFSIATFVLNYVAQIASSIGASLMGFIQAGVGALLRTVQDELRETVKVNQFTGADPTGATYSDAAILAALEVLKSDGVSINGTMTYNMGTLEFGKGEYLVHHSTLDLLGMLNLTFKGKGSRNFFSYWKGCTRLVVDGTGSTSSSFGIKLTADNSRNFRLKDMSLEYKNGFAGDLIKTTAPGLSIDGCYLGSTSTSSNRVYTCQNLINANNGHHYRLFRSTLTDAVRGIYGDNATAPNTNGWAIWGTTFYDFQRAAIETNTPSAFGMAITGCDFDPVDPGNVPLYGIKSTMYGVSIHGCNFAGSNLTNQPSVAWIEIDEGVADVSGNVFWGQDQYAILGTAGKLNLTANTFFCSKAVKITGTDSFTGKNNRYSHTGALTTDVAVEISPSSICTTDIGPDYFSSGFQYSYKIGGGSNITGRIAYNPDEDNTTSGFTYTNARGSIRIDSTHTNLDDVTAAGQLTAKMTGRTMNNVGTWTLPVSGEMTGQLEFSFFKSTTGTVTINAASSTTIYDGTGKSSIANSTTEVGSFIKLRSLDGSKWVVVQKVGTWA